MPAPYLLVGHSLGGFYARHYAHRFPGEVAGLVLLDPAHEDYDAYVPRELVSQEWLRIGLEEAKNLGQLNDELRRTGKMPDVPLIIRIGGVTAKGWPRRK